jgi:peptide-methionine (S)-S-oxide reductase
MFGRKSATPVDAAHALPGREQALAVTDRHAVLQRQIKPPFPAGHETALFGMGCFWGAERVFWQLPGVFTTAVGYAGGFTPNATYEEVCSGMTGHAEVVLAVYDPARIAFAKLLEAFWVSHDPTQGMRQGGDVGTQYRSAIYVDGDERRLEAELSRERYQRSLTERRFGRITTEIRGGQPFYYAEDYHQQYLAKNPGGYCGIGGCGVPYTDRADETRLSR